MRYLIPFILVGCVSNNDIVIGNQSINHSKFDIKPDYSCGSSNHCYFIRCDVESECSAIASGLCKNGYNIISSSRGHIVVRC